MEVHLFRILCLSLLALMATLANAQTNATTFQVGVILDVDSLEGRIGLTSLSLALSDFYTVNANYSTRLVLHVRNSTGQLLGAAASALSLLKDVEVDAMIGPQTSAQANLVIGLAHTAKVPLLSFSATTPFFHPQTPYFVQTAQNDAAQVDAIAALVNYFQWHQVVFVYEDSDYGHGIIPYLSNALQQVNARITYRSVIPVSASDDVILRELYKMKTMQTRVFVVHTSFSLASKFFPKVKEAEMMSEGYAWIVTSGLMDLFYSLDSQVVASMQGVLGVNYLIPESTELRNTSVKWKKKFSDDNPGSSQAEMNVYGVRAYDTLWALAVAAERVGFRQPSTSLQNTSDSNSTSMFITGISQTGPTLLKAVLEANFHGLGGSFRLVNWQLELPSLQILNVAGNRLREIGIWTPDKISSKEVRLKGVVWPGESSEANAPNPKGWEIPVSGKRLIVGVPAVAGFYEMVKVERDPQTNVVKVTGYYIDLFEAVMATLPYAVPYDYVPIDMTGGSDNLAYQVANGTVDMVVGDLSITWTRLAYADFSLPFEDGGITRIQRLEYDDPTHDTKFFLRPFNRDMWLTAIALFIFTGLALWIIEHRLNKAFRGPPSEHVGLIFYIPFMSLVFANRERIVSNLARVVVVVWMLVVLILVSTYTAALSAKLTAWRLKEVDRDVSDLVRDREYVGCRKGSFIVSYMKNTWKFEESKIRTYDTAEELREALTNGSIKAMFATSRYTDLFLNNHCGKFMRVGSPFITDQGYAFVFPKGSPLISDVSAAIIQLTDNGRLAEIKGRWIADSCIKDAPNDFNHARSFQIRLKSFKILFIMTAGITAACIVVHLASYLHQNRDFVHRISNSTSSTWSKLRAVFRHFDQRDPKSFRSGRSLEAGEVALSNSNIYPDSPSRVILIPSEPVSPHSESPSLAAQQVRSM